MTSPATSICRGFLGGRECALLWRKTTGDLVGADLLADDPVPSDLTAVPPTIHPVGSFMRDVWHETQGQWVACCDYTGVPTYDKATGALASPLMLGETLPDSVTLQPPPRGMEGPFQWRDDVAQWERGTLPPDEPGSQTSA